MLIQSCPKCQHNGETGGASRHAAMGPDLLIAKLQERADHVQSNVAIKFSRVMLRLDYMS